MSTSRKVASSLLAEEGLLLIGAAFSHGPQNRNGVWVPIKKKRRKCHFFAVGILCSGRVATEAHWDKRAK